MDIVYQAMCIMIYLTGVSGVGYISSKWRSDSKSAVPHPVIFEWKRDSLILCATDCSINIECSNFLYNNHNKSCMGFSSQIVSTTEPITDNSIFYIRLTVSELESTTKIQAVSEINTTENMAQTTEVTQQSGCVTDCTGKTDGDYQSCLGCTVYATCSNGFLIDNRPCPAGLYWDDSTKFCDYVSTTCT